MPITLHAKDIPEYRLGAWCNWLTWHGFSPDDIEEITLSQDGRSVTVRGIHGSETVGIKHALPYMGEPE